MTSLLFLNNNLHVVHHSYPSLPWYELPRRFRAEREAILRANGGFRFAGYREIVSRYALAAKDAPIHPRRGVERVARAAEVPCEEPRRTAPLRAASAA